MIGRGWSWVWLSHIYPYSVVYYELAICTGYADSWRYIDIFSLATGNHYKRESIVDRLTDGWTDWQTDKQTDI